jgi:4-alpha-glucanotransferase
MQGPGGEFFAAIESALGHLPLIAEDLGAVTPAVLALRDRFGLPGVKILQFAFGDDPQADTFRPYRFRRRAVVYTGTHDNDTTVGWFHDTGRGWTTRTPQQCERERAEALRYLASDGLEIHWDLIRAAIASVADLAIVPAQDLLGLGSEARMNRPGALGPENWSWRLTSLDALAAPLDRLADLTHTYGRDARQRW